jgi:hypothetical protein
VFSPVSRPAFEAPPSLLTSGYQGLFPRGLSGRSVKLTTHFHLLPTFQKYGAIPPLPNTLHGVAIKQRDTFTLPCPNVLHAPPIIYLSQYSEWKENQSLKSEHLCTALSEYHAFMLLIWPTNASLQCARDQFFARCASTL